MENQSQNGVAATKISVLNCIDLSNPNIHQSVSLLKQACLDSGFFYVVNHGISEEFMDEVFAQSRRLFELPLSEKIKLLRNEKHRGYTPVLDELLDPENQVHGDYKEGYYIGVEVSEDDPEAEKPFYGPNVWPAHEILPGWRETMEKFHREALSTLDRVLVNGQERYSFDNLYGCRHSPPNGLMRATDDMKMFGIVHFPDTKSDTIVLAEGCLMKLGQTLQMVGSIRGQLMDVLIDGGSSGNFIKSSKANLLELPISPSTPFSVMVANGEYLRCDGCCEETQLEIQGYSFPVDLHVLPLGGFDVVLGVPWLAQLGPIVFDYRRMTMKFKIGSQVIRLRGKNH